MRKGLEGGVEEGWFEDGGRGGKEQGMGAEIWKLEREGMKQGEAEVEGKRFRKGLERVGKG